MTKALKIRELLKSRILSGLLANGEQLPPLRQLAEEYSVSYLTVSRALDQLEQDRLILRVQGRGVFVNYQYRRMPRTHCRVVLMYHGRDAITPLFIEKLFTFFCSRQDELTLLEMSALDGLPPEIAQKRLTEYLSHPAEILIVDGIFTLPFREIDKHRQNFRRIIFFNRYESDVELLNVSRLLYDYREAGRCASRAFLENRRRRIVYMAPDSRVRHLYPPYGPDVTYHWLMRAGIEEELRGSTAKLENLIVTPDTLRKEVLRILKSFRPDAFFVFHDYCAIKVIQILSEHGIKVGRQVDVVGCFDTDIGKKWLIPELSTISFNSDLMLQGLQRILSDEAVNLKLTIPPELIRRNSMRERKCSSDEREGKSPAHQNS